MGGTFTYKGMEDEENLFSLRDLDYNVMGELHVNRNPPTINKHIYLKVSPNLCDLDYTTMHRTTCQKEPTNNQQTYIT